LELGLTGKRALVTGSSRGIGYAIAEGLVAEGVRVALTARTAADVEAAADRLRERGGDVVALTGDLTLSADVERVVQGAAEAFGGLDILINNVGGGIGGNTDEGWQYTFDVNLNAAVRASRAATPLMQAQRSGVILIISSVSGWQVGGSPQYNAAKAAEIMYARSLAKELGADGIRVNAVSPGSIMFEGGGWARRKERDPEGIAAFIANDMPLGRFGTPEEIANVCVFLCSERASLVTGANIAVDGCQLKPSI
jgi:3-oxoacyl-[acyl-carrier protein] reductase